MDAKTLKDGEPCSYPGCLSHISHPCEGCGRIGGRTVTKLTPKQARIVELKDLIIKEAERIPCNVGLKKAKKCRAICPNTLLCWYFAEMQELRAGKGGE